MNGTTFFLRIKTQDNVFYPGQPLEVLVRDITLESRSVAVKLPSATAMKDEPNRNATVPFISLTPGMRFEVMVDKKVNVSD